MVNLKMLSEHTVKKTLQTFENMRKVKQNATSMKTEKTQKLIKAIDLMFFWSKLEGPRGGPSTRRRKPETTFYKKTLIQNWNC